MEKYYLGLDGGSTYLKAALMKDKKVVGTVVYPTELTITEWQRKLWQHCVKNTASAGQI